MSIQITILGLDKIGASAGLGLGRHSDQVERTGFDHKHATALHARKIHAVDRAELNLPKSIKQADVIFLAMPLNLLKETLRTIASDVRTGVVILDTSPAKLNVAAWVSELFSTKYHYVGITPLLNSHYLNNQDESIQSASPDLFDDSLMGIASPAGTDPAAIKLAADLSGLLGATPFFCDMAEMDGFAASTRLLPQLVSTALLNATLNQPGWMDASKFTGAEYTAASAGIAGREESTSLCEAVLLNKTNLLRSLDGMLAALYALRDDVENDQTRQLELKLESARDGRMKWW
ncbi:MAG: prephenate dehydrogenase/arogenate dehydrogenase family protein, partial [Chloroflexota bacterium]